MESLGRPHYATQRAFSLLSILMSLLLVAGLGLYIIPLIRQHQVSHAKNVCIANLKRLGQATLMYAHDYDQVMPQTVANVNSQWLINYWVMVPANWSADKTHPSVIGSRFVWPNTVIQYGVEDADLKCPSARIEKSQLPRFTYDTPTSQPIPVSYTMNGLLNALELNAISSMGTVPLVWEGMGRFAMLGGTVQNPMYWCGGPRPCRFSTGTTDNERSDSWGLFSTAWIHGAANHIVYVDGHCSSVLFGVEDPSQPKRSPGIQTNYKVDPFTGYDNRGRPHFIWKEDRHLPFFRPY